MEYTFKPWYKTKGAIIAIILAFTLGVLMGSSSSGEEISKSNTKQETLSSNKENSEPVQNRSEFKPIKLNGSGQQSTDKIELKKGLYKATLTHNGSRHFGVTVLDENGDWVDLLANDTGSFNGSKALTIKKDGQYVLDVSADGNWTVNITK